MGEARKEQGGWVTVPAYSMRDFGRLRGIEGDVAAILEGYGFSKQAAEELGRLAFHNALSRGMSAEAGSGWALARK